MALPLPKFDNPPLTEMILGIQFDPERKLRTGHLGQYLASLGAEWVQVHDVPPLGQTHEPVQEAPDWLPQGINIQLSLGTEVRLCARRRDGTRIVQVENGWFVYNWSVQSQQPYPSYDKLKGEFSEAFSDFVKFIDGVTGCVVRPNLWELGYVNVVPPGDLWNRPSEWPGVVPGLFSAAALPTAGQLQTASGRWAYVNPAAQARLQVFAEHALANPQDSRGALVLRLIARGPKVDTRDLFASFEEGHRMVVTTFASIISDQARIKWGLRA